MSETMYDVVIIGGGPAGLTAGLYTSRAKLKTLLIEGMILGGQVMTTTKVENYPGFPGGIDGPDLMERMQQHCQEFGLEVEYGEVESLEDEGNVKIVGMVGKKIRARAVIVASGAEPRKLDVPGEREFTGRGVSYCATCDGAFFREATVAIVGGGDTAAEEALFLTRFAKRVYIIHRRDSMRATQILQDRIVAQPKIEMLWNTTVEAIRGDASGVNRIDLNDTVSGEKRSLPVEGIFMAIGVLPKAKFLQGVLDMDDEGYILTDDECRTSMPGVFAAGDVRKKLLKQIATAVGDGATVAYVVERYLFEESAH